MEACWGGLKRHGRVLEASWGRLGGVSEPSWASWGYLGGVLEVSWGHLGSVLKAKIVDRPRKANLEPQNITFARVYDAIFSGKKCS